jgi:hypothetical protein
MRDQDAEELMLVDMRMMLDKPLRIDVRKDRERLSRWNTASSYGLVTVSPLEADGIVLGTLTDKGRATLAERDRPRVPEPIEGTISPWMPITDPIHLAVLGKLGEECNELGARIFRTIIQGLDEQDPASKRTNREEIAREIADVEACVQTIKRELGIDYDDQRVNGKRNGFVRWFRMIRERVGLPRDHGVGSP